MLESPLLIRVLDPRGNDQDGTTTSGLTASRFSLLTFFFLEPQTRHVHSKIETDSKHPGHHMTHVAVTEMDFLPNEMPKMFRRLSDNVSLLAWLAALVNLIRPGLVWGPCRSPSLCGCLKLAEGQITR